MTMFPHYISLGPIYLPVLAKGHISYLVRSVPLTKEEKWLSTTIMGPSHTRWGSFSHMSFLSLLTQDTLDIGSTSTVTNIMSLFFLGLTGPHRHCDLCHSLLSLPHHRQRLPRPHVHHLGSEQAVIPHPAPRPPGSSVCSLYQWVNSE